MAISSDTSASIIHEKYMGLSNEWHALMQPFIGELRVAIGPLIKLKPHEMCPHPSKLFRAFEMIPNPRDVKCVLLGQDPYPNLTANGLSFACDTSIPPSLQNIFKCLIKCELMQTMPICGNLDAWAKQGVLLLNTALSVKPKESGSHAKQWDGFTLGLIKALDLLIPAPIFILLGNNAQMYEKYIRNPLVWSHPSPICAYNNDDANPKAFIHCDCFTKCNDLLIARKQKPIVWDLGAKLPSQDYAIEDVGWKYGVPDANGVWIITDGACYTDSSKKRVSTWAFLIITPSRAISAKGVSNGLQTNNRGEIIALLNGLITLQREFKSVGKNITIVSDSKYLLGCAQSWIGNWLSDESGQECMKKNLDLLIPLYDELLRAKSNNTIAFEHIDGHLKAPKDNTEKATAFWKANAFVDSACHQVS